MRHKWICMVVLAGVAAALSLAEPALGQPVGKKGPRPLGGRITRVQGNTIYFQPYNPTTKQFGPVQQYQVVGDKVQIYQTLKGKRVPVTGGLQANVFQSLGEQGYYTTIVTQDGRVAEIVLLDQSDWETYLSTPQEPVTPGVVAPGGAAVVQPTPGRIVKVEGTTVYFQPYDAATNTFGPVQTYQVVNDQLQVYRILGKEKRQVITGGLQAEPFRTLGPKGSYGTFVIRDGRVVEIGVMDDPVWKYYQSAPKVKVVPGGGG